MYHIFSPFCNGRAVFNLLIGIYKKASASFWILDTKS